MDVSLSSIAGFDHQLTTEVALYVPEKVQMPIRQREPPDASVALRPGGPHGAHAQDAGADHAPDGDEHGCSGTFHLCSCHHSPPTVLALAPATHPDDLPDLGHPTAMSQG